MTKIKKIEYISNPELDKLLTKIQRSEEYDVETVRDLISEQIFVILETQKISRSELAKRLGKSRAYVTKLLQGNGNFTIETLVKIARALGYIFVPRFAMADHHRFRPFEHLTGHFMSEPDNKEIVGEQDFAGSKFVIVRGLKYDERIDHQLINA